MSTSLPLQDNATNSQKDRITDTTCTQKHDASSNYLDSKVTKISEVTCISQFLKINYTVISKYGANID